jgi:hypothetical protein
MLAEDRDLEFRVDMWDGRDNLIEVLAKCSRLSVGISAFMAARAAYPRDRLTLRHGARVIRDYPGRD